MNQVVLVIRNETCMTIEVLGISYLGLFAMKSFDQIFNLIKVYF